MTQNFKGVVKLSEENYVILSTTGTLALKDGSVLTYDPVGTVYITPDSTINFTQQDKDKVEIIDISGDGNKFLSDDGVYKEIESGISQLVGTDFEEPINFATDMEVGKLYTVKGTFFYNEELDPGYISDPILCFKSSEGIVEFFNAKVSIFGETHNIMPSVGGLLRLIINGATGEVNIEQYSTGVSSLNGSTDLLDIYAPISSGTAGQLLQSNGEGAPTWVTPNIDVVKTDTSTIPEIYNLLQTKFNENKSISFTLKYIGHILGASVPSYGYDPNSMEMEPYNINLQLLNDTQRTHLPCKVIGISNSRIQCTFETIDAVGSFEIAEDNIYGLSLNYEHVVSEKYAIGCDFNGLVLSSGDRTYGLNIISC